MMHSFLTAWLGIFVAQDVLGILPLFVSMVYQLSTEERNQIINRSMLVAWGVALGFILAGEGIFRFLGIQLFDFKIAGGIVLLLVALTDLMGNSYLDGAAQRTVRYTGVVPLGVPLITGPAVITTVILQVNQFGYWVTLLALLVNYATAWLILRHAINLTRFMGKEGSVVISKIAALFVAAIGISMIRSGITGAIHLI